MDISIIKNQINRLIELLSCPDIDVTWSSYDNAEQIINELKKVGKGIFDGDIRSINKMKSLLGPTGSLQEISISSGWGNEFIEIANTIELEFNRIKE